MSEPTAYIHVDLAGEPRLVGRLFVTSSRGRETARSCTMAPGLRFFDLTPTAARAVAKEIALAVSRWRDVAARLGIAPGEITRMESAFEHEDLAAALRY